MRELEENFGHLGIFNLSKGTLKNKRHHQRTDAPQDVIYTIDATETKKKILPLPRAFIKNIAQNYASAPSQSPFSFNITLK